MRDRGVKRHNLLLFYIFHLLQYRIFFFFAFNHLMDLFSLCLFRLKHDGENEEVIFIPKGIKKTAYESNTHFIPTIIVCLSEHFGFKTKKK